MPELGRRPIHGRRPSADQRFFVRLASASSAPIGLSKPLHLSMAITLAANAGFFGSRAAAAAAPRATAPAQG
jgi:hypothetical protein